jgi:predicted metal-dependent hydrolase
MTERDRDESGRAQSARPRDALGRPLSRGSQGVEPIPDDLDLSPTESLVYVQELIDRGLAFNAHEVLEAAWKRGPVKEKPLWQGLAQLAVGITHVQRGNANGAIALLRRAATHLGGIDGAAPYSVDVPGLIDYADALVEDLTAGVELKSARLRPALTVSRDEPPSA